jgi:nucleotide-binding universal stress UspA family protein
MVAETDRDGPKSGFAHEEYHTYLCVVDQSEELHQALRYACNRAKATGGRIALLYVIEPAEFNHWMAVGDLMRHERRQEAEEMLQVVARTVQQRTGSMPVIYIREGNVLDELLDLLKDRDAGISVLVLGANTGSAGPGPLVSQLTQKLAGRIHIPITIVPGNMTDEEIDSIT